MLNIHQVERLTVDIRVPDKPAFAETASFPTQPQLVT
jgi:hypothetical protein